MPSAQIQAPVDFQLSLVFEKQICLMARKLQQEDVRKFSACKYIHWIAFCIRKDEERDARAQFWGLTPAMLASFKWNLKKLYAYI